MSMLAVLKNVAERMPPELEVEFEFEGHARHGEPPRVSFDVDGMTESFGGPAGAGIAGQPRALWMRTASVEAEIWGKDQEATEKLLNHLVAALHEAAAGSYAIRAGKWRRGGESALGVGYVLVFELLVPITREPEATAPITSMPQTAEINNEPE